MIPFKPTGIGAVAAKNVIKFVFSEALSYNPKLKAWDDYWANSVSHKIFIGTPVSGYQPPEPGPEVFVPMIGAIGLTAAPSADWFPTTMIQGAAVDIASLLRGNDGFCLLSATPPEADGEVFYNVDYLFPSDGQPSDSWAHVVEVEYQYTGDTPSVAAYANKGTEETPDWQALVMGIKGYAPEPGVTEFRPCDAGEGYGGTGEYLFTFPESGQAHPDEIWLKDYEA